MTKAIKTPKKTRADSQISGLAAEFFVAAELLKRDLQVALTLGNAKAIDLFANNHTTGKSFKVQVKGLRAPNYFPLAHNKVKRDCVYIFVVLNKPSVPPNFYVVPGELLLEKPELFGKYFLNYAAFPGIHSRELAKFKENWQLFEN